MATLKIKNMVCDRCVSSVRNLLQDFGHDVKSVELGKAEIDGDLEEDQYQAVAQRLQQRGFELITETSDALIESIKTQLIKYLAVLVEEEDPPKLSSYLSEKLHRNYSYLSSRFSSGTDLTIEQYFIQLKIERVKEWLTYQEMTLSEIAWKLNYSSVQYLSNQFKKVTGETVSTFRSHLDTSHRQSLDQVT
jgi:YesN/AraC family two-component response regulator